MGSMNVFRIVADLSHLASIIILIHRIHARQTCAGISLRTHVLYLTVFLMRYQDLFLYYISFYNTIGKLTFITTSAWIVYLMLGSNKYKESWYKELDTFPYAPLLGMSALIALLFPHSWSYFEIVWSFSIVLESVAILPQLLHLTKVPDFPALPLSHLLCLGLYRGLYIVNWIYRYALEGYFSKTSVLWGTVQTIIWIDFLWVWYNRKQIKLTSVEEDAETGMGSTPIDEGDLSRSVVLKFVFKVATGTETWIRTRTGVNVNSGLSVSAYPDQQVVPATSASEFYDVETGTEEAGVQKTRASTDNVSFTEQARSSPPVMAKDLDVRDEWTIDDSGLTREGTPNPLASSTV